MVKICAGALRALSLGGRSFLLCVLSLALHVLMASQAMAQSAAIPSDIKLVRGWNLLGNGQATPISTASVFSDPDKVVSIWKWDAAMSAWAFYTPKQADGGAAYALSKGYVPLQSIGPGEGYWVNASTAFSVAVTAATLVHAEQFRPDSATAMLSGWNLISIGDDITPGNFNQSLSSTPPSPGEVPQNLISLWAWEPINSAWYFYAPSLDAKGQLAQYTADRKYLDFSAGGPNLRHGVGFWVNNPAKGITAVRGTLSNLQSGSRITLANGLAQQVLAFNGVFSFSVPVNSTYEITIATPAPGQTCVVSNGAGTAGNGLPETVVSNIAINCSAPVTQPKTQTITFSQPTAQLVGDTLSLSATASSGLAVSFSASTPQVCTLSGSTLTFVAAGTCSITASQAGNSAYAAASVTRSIAVSQKNQTITFAQPAGMMLGDVATLNASASSGLPVSYTSTTTSVCTVSGNKLSTLAAGTCTVVANQAGNATYSAAANVGRSVYVTDNSTSPAMVTRITAGFNWPQGVLVDAASNVYVADAKNNRIVKVNSAGISSNFSSVQDPSMMTWDSTGNIFASSYSGRSIYKIDSAGSASIYSTNHFNPEGIALTSDGTMYVVATYSNIMRRVAAGGGAAQVFANLPNAYNIGAVTGSDGNIYVGGNNGGSTSTILKITPGGAISTFATIPMSGVNGVVFDAYGNLYAAVCQNIYKVSPTGAVSRINLDKQLTCAWGLAFDSSGALYVTDVDNSGPGLGALLKISLYPATVNGRVVD